MTDKVPDKARYTFSKSATGESVEEDERIIDMLRSTATEVSEGIEENTKKSLRTLNDLHSDPDTSKTQPQTLNETFADQSATTARNETFPVRTLEHTPFHEKDVEVSELKKVGLYLKKPLENMSQGQKQVAMYGLQISAAAFLGVAGALMVGGGAPLAATVGAGYLATGGFNSVRSILQVKAREKFATTPENSAKTEIANSLASGGTNAPQAFMSMSPAAFAALAIYATRSLNYSVQSDELSKLAHPADLEPQENTPFENADVEVESSRFINFVNENCKTAKKIMMDNLITPTTDHVVKPAYKGMVKTGHQVEKVPGGKWIMEKGPPVGMFVRAGLQAAEGITAAALAGPVAGVMVTMAGVSYLAAATFMAAADSAPPEPGPEADLSRDERLAEDVSERSKVKDKTQDKLVKNTMANPPLSS